MKKILTVYTGGTISTEEVEGVRALCPTLSRRLIVELFKKTNSKYANSADEIFVDSHFPEEKMTLSECMTPSRVFDVANHTKEKLTSEYSGVIILHGTDTLAYSAAIFSLLFAGVDIPIMLVSAGLPPAAPGSNAIPNFRTAAELIMAGIPAGVYAPYKNSRGDMMLYSGARIMQSDNYSDDFSAKDGGYKLKDSEDYSTLFEEISNMRKNRCKKWDSELFALETPAPVLLLYPYTGLDYSLLDVSKFGAVVHGTYHSGTVMTSSCSSPYSVLTLADACRAADVPLVIAPTRLGEGRYESADSLFAREDIILVDMTSEAAYAKAICATALGYCGGKFKEFIAANIAGE